MVKVVLATLLVACLALIVWTVASLKGSQATVGGYVISTWVKANGNDGSDYYVSIQKDDGTIEVFQDVNSSVFWKDDSSDVFAQLGKAQRQNKHVFVTVAGARSTFWITFRSILSVNTTIT